MVDYYEDVFLKTATGIEICDEEKALSILLAEHILFANTREYIERDWKDGKRLETYDIEEETIVLFVNCNDLFYWGCADAEALTTKEIPELFRMWRNDKNWGVSKWCCKKRKMQPQEPIRKDMKKDGAWESWMDKLEDPGPS